jgi:hypothetical protein
MSVVGPLPKRRKAAKGWTRKEFEALTDDDLYFEVKNAFGEKAYQPKSVTGTVGYMGTLKTAEAARQCALASWISKAPPSSDVHGHPDAAGLLAIVKRVAEGDKPWPAAKGFRRHFATGFQARPVKGGFNLSESGTEGGVRWHTISRFVAWTELDAVRQELADKPAMLAAVEGLAAFTETATEQEVRRAKLARAIANHRVTRAKAVLRNTKARERLERLFWEGKAAFWKEVGVDAAVCEAIGVASPDELDKFPEKAVLGNVDCPAYGKCLAQIFESQRRGNRGDVDAAKNKMRGLLKEDGIKEVLRARFEDLADSRWDYIIDNMYKLVHFDHIFSSACTGRGLFLGPSLDRQSPRLDGERHAARRH